MLKYLLVIAVVGVVVWLLTAKARTRNQAPGRASRSRGVGPQAMVACAHCGLHLPAADAVFDGSRVYCGDAHRALGPRSGG